MSCSVNAGQLMHIKNHQSKERYLRSELMYKEHLHAQRSAAQQTLVGMFGPAPADFPPFQGLGEVNQYPRTYCGKMVHAPWMRKTIEVLPSAFAWLRPYAHIGMQVLHMSKELQLGDKCACSASSSLGQQKRLVVS